MVVFITVVVVLGTAIFFYWRRTYGVWAVKRRERENERASSEPAQTIKYD